MPTADNDGISIHYELAGDGPPVLLLHGFPDTGRLWRHQVPRLVGTGFRVIVPDMRGYGASSKPGDVAAYSIVNLVSDTKAVLSDAGAERAHVVGHDWGAVVAWALASFAPERVDRLVVLSVGHPSTFKGDAGRIDFAQLEKSWYALFFQFPSIAEEWLSKDGWANFRAFARHPDIDEVTSELEANSSLTPALNYYRANLSPDSFVRPPAVLPPVKSATMGIWSSGDPALGEAQMLRSAGQVAGPWRYERLEGPGHWLQLEAPEAVSALLLDFLSKRESPRADEPVEKDDSGGK